MTICVVPNLLLTPNKYCFLVHVLHTKSELLFWCQLKFGNKKNGHPEYYYFVGRIFEPSEVEHKQLICITKLQYCIKWCFCQPTWCPNLLYVTFEVPFDSYNMFSGRDQQHDRDRAGRDRQPQDRHQARQSRTVRVNMPEKDRGFFCFCCTVFHATSICNITKLWSWALPVNACSLFLT